MNKILISLAALSMLVLTSCYHTIGADDERDNNIENTLVINAIINPDSVISAVITRPYFFTDEHNSPSYVPGLTVMLTVNGQDCGMLKWDEKTGRYISTVKPEPGDVVRLATSFFDRNYTCQDTVPQPVAIGELTDSIQGPVSIYTKSDYVVTYKLTFTDEPGKQNYYFLQWDVADEHAELMGERDFTHELVFQQLANHVNSQVPGWTPYSYLGLPFSDEGIDGQPHTLQLREIIQGGNDGEMPRMPKQRVFKLYAISRPYYNYLLSILCNDTDDSSIKGGMLDIGLVNPVKIYTNIECGYGILCSYVMATKTLNMR